MGLLHDTFEFLTDDTVDFIQNIFSAVATPISALLYAAGVLSLILIALNAIFQYRIINFSTYSSWAFRYVLVLMFATVWSNFKLFYDVVVGIPSDYAIAIITTSLLDLSTVSDDVNFDVTKVENVAGNKIWMAMDEYANLLFDIANSLISGFNFAAFNIDVVLIGLAVYIMAIVYIAGATVILVVSYLGLAIFMSLAPLAISLLMFPQTKGYFESWLKLTIGYALVPVLAGGILSAVVSMGLKHLPV